MGSWLIIGNRTAVPNPASTTYTGAHEEFKHICPQIFTDIHESVIIKDYSVLSLQNKFFGYDIVIVF